MEALDRIYIPNNPVVISAAYSSRAAGNDVEYIRKDALLEWLKMAVEYYSHPDYVLVCSWTDFVLEKV